MKNAIFATALFFFATQANAQAQYTWNLPTPPGADSTLPPDVSGNNLAVIPSRAM